MARKPGKKPKENLAGFSSFKVKDEKEQYDRSDSHERSLYANRATLSLDT